MMAPEPTDVESTQLFDFANYPEGYAVRSYANQPWEFIPIIEDIDCEEFMAWLAWQDMWNVHVHNFSIVCPSLSYVQQIRENLPRMVADYLDARALKQKLGLINALD
jgi:hypothetical protein